MLISVAESYLKQLDLRKRQVAVKVQILSVTLDNDKSIDSSFSARMGDVFLVSQSGKAHMNFGQNMPSSADATGVYDGSNPMQPGVLPGDSGVPAQIVNPSFIPLAESAEVVEDRDESGKITGYTVLKKPLLVNGQEVYVPDANPNSQQQLVPVYDKYGRENLVPKRELNSYKDDSFYSYVEAMI